MGRSPDLPDPLENHNDAAGSGGADDLLSQLAGDEIDRLLAEADAEAASAPPSPPAREVEAAAATVDASAAPEVSPSAPPAAAARGESEASTDAAAAVAETPAPAEAGTEPALETQLDDLFKALNEPAPAPETPATPAAPPAPLKPAAAAAASDLDAQLERLAQELLPMPEQEKALTAAQPAPPSSAAAGMATSAASPSADQPATEEREALLATAPEELEALAAAAELGDDDATSGELPWFLQPLLWLNAPFASLSDRGRELVGKVALATLLFSITVLTFLALTRHHL